MPHVPVMLTSFRSCICMIRTPSAHPGSRGRNRPQPQPYFIEATRMGRGPCWWCSPKERFHRGWGGGRLFNFGSVRPPCAASIIPLQGKLFEYVFSSLGQMLHCWIGQYGRGKPNELARCRSRNTPTEFQYTYLVKSRSLLLGPVEGESIRSI